MQKQTFVMSAQKKNSAHATPTTDEALRESRNAIQRSQAEVWTVLNQLTRVTRAHGQTEEGTVQRRRATNTLAIARQAMLDATEAAYAVYLQHEALKKARAAARKAAKAAAAEDEGDDLDSQEEDEDEDDEDKGDGITQQIEAAASNLSNTN